MLLGLKLPEAEDMEIRIRFFDFSHLISTSILFTTYYTYK